MLRLGGDHEPGWNDVNPKDLANELKGPNPPSLLDVREPDELEISKIPYDVHIPLGMLPERFRELDRDKEWVVVCRSGARSASAVEFLRQAGYKVRNLDGGILRWSKEVDSSVPSY